MVNEAALRDVLVAIARDLKGNFETLTATMAELASLRETVRALDPTFAEILEQKRNNLRNQVGEQYQNALVHFDEIIVKLEAGYVC